MEDRERPSLVARIVGPPFFLLFGLATAIVFGVFAHGLWTDLLTGADSVSFNKGAFYMLGVSLGSILLSVAIGYEFWLDKVVSNWWNMIVTRALLASVAIMLILPHVTHFAVNTHVKDQGYTVCREASKQWLFVRTIVYTRSDDTCLEISED